MVDVRNIVVSVVAVLSVFPQPGIRAQPTTGGFSEDDWCSSLEEVGLELRSGLEREQQRAKTLENRSYSQAEEIQRLHLELENERGRPVTTTLVRRLETGIHHSGITIVGDSIYILCSPDSTRNTIQVYEDQNDFRFVREIALTEISYPIDIVYSNESECIYISDQSQKCIWVMPTTGEHRLTKWLTDVTSPKTLSLSNDGHLLVLRNTQLETYSLDATLIRTLELPEDIGNPNHVVQTSAGNFIISHQIDNVSDEPWVISQLTNDGKLVNRFIPRDNSEKLYEPRHLCLDSDNNRLFVADYVFKRILLFDSNFLTWSQVLLSDKSVATLNPWRLFYDSTKKLLLSADVRNNVHVFEIN